MLTLPKWNEFVLEFWPFFALSKCYKNVDDSATCEGIPCWGEAGRFKEGGETGGEGGGEGEEGRLWGR